MKSRLRSRAFLSASVSTVAALSFASLACVSTADGDAMRGRTTALETRVTAVESVSQSFEAETARAHTKVQELESVLERATRVVTRASADTGAQVETMREQLATQEGAIAEVRNELSRLQREFQEQQADYENRMKKLARRAGIDMPVEEGEIPAAPAEHLQAARTAYEARDFSRARALYRAFVTRYPRDDHADDAQYFVGQSYLLEDRPATALGELRRVLSEYASGDAVPRTLLAMGDAFYRLHACTESRASYDAIIRGHSRAPEATDARTKLRDVQRAPAGYCTS